MNVEEAFAMIGSLVDLGTTNFDVSVLSHPAGADGRVTDARVPGRQLVNADLREVRFRIGKLLADA